MARSSWERWAPASGMLYAVFFLVGILLIVLGDISDSSDERVMSHYASSGNRASEIAGFFLIALSVLFFLHFVSAVS